MASLHNWARTVEPAEDAIIAVDRERRITYFNPAAERLFGYAAGEICGQPLEALLSSRSGCDLRAEVVEFPGSRQAGPAPPNSIASSESMRQLLKFATRVAVSEASTILIEGESGSERMCWRVSFMKTAAAAGILFWQ